MKEERASSTAYTVIHGILHTAKNPQLSHLVDEETVAACTQILSATALGRKRLAELGSPVKSRLLPFLEWLLLPGITLNYVLRKKVIEEKVLQAIEAGTTQIVNIGAGFDTLSWRLSQQFASVTFIEIDHPATSREKTDALCSAYAPSNLYFVEADLSKVLLQKALEGCEGFNVQQTTLYVCEGVLMYLKEQHVSALFESLKRLTGAGSIFVFTCMEPNESEKNNVRTLLHLYLKLKNERYLWYIRDTEVPDFIKKHDYTLMEMADSETYRNRYLPKNYDGLLHRGEYVVVAEVS
jgi:methyltransferase (TIGR00027 family)